MKNILGFFIILAILISPLLSEAQTTMKHPRVSELEKTLTKESLDFLKGRFPGHPFMASVSIDPLFREKNRNSEAKESLPYYQMSDEEVVDEWDDPALSNSVLMTRVKKIQVTLSVPSTLTDDEISELKQAMISNLGMIEARDQIEVRKRTFSSNEIKEDRTVTFLGWGAFAWLLFMIGLIGVVWISANKMSNAFALAQSKSNNSGNSAGGIPTVAPTISDSKQDRGSGSGLAGDVRFNDPIKTREVISNSVKRLEEHSGFPTLEDMIILHKFSEENPQGLGALLAEFPTDLSHKVFSFSQGDTWLEAMNEPGDVDHHSMTLLNKLIRLQRSELDKELQDLLICVWRLGDKQSDFLKSLSKSEAMSLLHQLPPSLAIASAREVFPGAWAALLDKDFKVDKMSKDRIIQLKGVALKFAPLREWGILEKYKNDKELLSYLKTADPVTEKEIYTASGDIEMLESIRPPFYKVFELSDEQYDRYVQKISIDEWSLSFFNISRIERKGIEKRFTDKQRFRYYELLRSFDTNPPTKNRVGEARERIAKFISQSNQIEKLNRKEEQVNKADQPKAA